MEKLIVEKTEVIDELEKKILERDNFVKFVVYPDGMQSMVVGKTGDNLSYSDMLYSLSQILTNTYKDMKSKGGKMAEGAEWIKSKLAEAVQYEDFWEEKIDPATLKSVYESNPSLN